LSRSERDGSGVGAPGRIVTFTPATAEAQAAATGGKPRGQALRKRKPSNRSATVAEADFDRAQLDIIRDMLAQDASPTAVAESAGVARRVVYRFQADPAEAEPTLAEWTTEARIHWRRFRLSPSLLRNRYAG
jgi:DNA invertase Pin-like site-specific DNA recombinase